MNRLKSKTNNAGRRQNRVRSRVIGTTKRPRLSVNISNLHVLAQIIDDSTSKTLAFATTASNPAEIKGKTMTEKAAWVGSEIAKQAVKKKIKQVAFDRGSKLYHGRIKTLADAARNEGLEF